MQKRLRRAGYLVSVSLVLGGCAATDVPEEPLLFKPTDLGQRPVEDLAFDSVRNPRAIFRILGVQEGMTAIDLVAIGGYYTEALAHAVGMSGRVYAHNPSRVLRFAGGVNDRAMTARLRGNRLPNVRRLDREIAELGLVAESVDVAVTRLDLDELNSANPVAAGRLLAAISQILKPGGVLGVLALSSPASTELLGVARDSGFLAEVHVVPLLPKELLPKGDSGNVLAEGITHNQSGAPSRQYVLKLTKAG